MIIQHTLNLLNFSKTIDAYKTFLRYTAPNYSVIEKALTLLKLNDFERKIINELLSSNYHEYLMKNDYQSCCYTAMNAFLGATYCIIFKGINFHIDEIDIMVDIYDILQTIRLKKLHLLQNLYT